MESTDGILSIAEGLLGASTYLSPSRVIKRSKRHVPKTTPVTPSPGRSEAARAMMALVSAEAGFSSAEKPPPAKGRHSKRAAPLSDKDKKRRRREPAAKVSGCAEIRPKRGSAKASEAAKAVPKPRARPAKPTFKRKYKSLGLLCMNFVHICRENVLKPICLNEMAAQLDVERRRIYDIVNILEALAIVGRRGKNRYVWHGTNRLGETLSVLERLAVSQGTIAPAPGYTFGCVHNFLPGGTEHAQLASMGSPTVTRKDLTESKSPDAPAADMKAMTPVITTPVVSSASTSCSTETVYSVRSVTAMEDDVDYSLVPSVGISRTGNTTSTRREKSLAVLSQRFIMTFLLGRQVVSLDEASQLLIPKSSLDPSVMKTKIRRLYDIANVLSSIGLIAKVKVLDTRKPAFCWKGIGNTLPGVDPVVTEPLKPRTRRLDKHLGDVLGAETPPKRVLVHPGSPVLDGPADEGADVDTTDAPTASKSPISATTGTPIHLGASMRRPKPILPKPVDDAPGR